MTSVAIRPALASDVPAITAIYRPAVVAGTASFELEPPDETEMLRRFGSITEAGFPYVVADDGGQVLGYAYCSSYRPRPAYRYSVENSVYVAPSAQGRSIGRALLSHLVESATERGYRQMIAVIGDPRETASVGLHRSLGFTLCGTIRSVGYKHGRWLDSVVMQRALGAGDTAPPVPL